MMMKTVFDKTTQDELITRINTLGEQSTAQWGKMNVYQMLKHCTLWDEMVLHNVKYDRVFIGRLIGKWILTKELKDDRPMGRNNPTIRPFVIKETNGDIVSEKTKWQSLIQEYNHYTLPDYSFVHPFFGKMTREQIGFQAYKHSDHHLRQFMS